MPSQLLSNSGLHPCCKQSCLRLPRTLNTSVPLRFGSGRLSVEIRFEIPAIPTRFNYEKVSKRTYLDISSVNSAISIQTSNRGIAKIHIAAGGVAPFPLYLTKTCAYLTGKTITPKIIRSAIEIAANEITPISDIRGSARYKRILFKQLILAHFLKLFHETISWETLRNARPVFRQDPGKRPTLRLSCLWFYRGGSYCRLPARYVYCRQSQHNP